MEAQIEKNSFSIWGIADIQKMIQPILGKYPIKRASIFGSYARQEARTESDIDILVELSSSISLLQFVNIQATTIIKPTHIVPHLSIHPHPSSKHPQPSKTHCQIFANQRIFQNHVFPLQILF